MPRPVEETGRRHQLQRVGFGRGAGGEDEVVTRLLLGQAQGPERKPYQRVGPVKRGGQLGEEAGEESRLAMWPSSWRSTRARRGSGQVVASAGSSTTGCNVPHVIGTRHHAAERSSTARVSSYWPAMRRVSAWDRSSNNDALRRRHDHSWPAPTTSLAHRTATPASQASSNQVPGVNRAGLSVGGGGDGLAADVEATPAATGTRTAWAKLAIGLAGDEAAAAGGVSALAGCHDQRGGNSRVSGRSSSRANAASQMRWRLAADAPRQRRAASKARVSTRGTLEHQVGKQEELGGGVHGVFLFFAFLMMASRRLSSSGGSDSSAVSTRAATALANDPFEERIHHLFEGGATGQGGGLRGPEAVAGTVLPVLEKALVSPGCAARRGQPNTREHPGLPPSPRRRWPRPAHKSRP